MGSGEWVVGSGWQSPHIATTAIECYRMQSIAIVNVKS